MCVLGGRWCVTAPVWGVAGLSWEWLDAAFCVLGLMLPQGCRWQCVCGCGGMAGQSVGL